VRLRASISPVCSLHGSLDRAKAPAHSSQVIQYFHDVAETVTQMGRELAKRAGGHRLWSGPRRRLEAPPARRALPAEGAVLVIGVVPEDGAPLNSLNHHIVECPGRRFRTKRGKPTSRARPGTTGGGWTRPLYLTSQLSQGQGVEGGVGRSHDTWKEATGARK
jgi:hypothetical protein